MSYIGDAKPKWPNGYACTDPKHEDFSDDFVKDIKILLMPATSDEEKEILRYLEPKDEKVCKKYIKTTIDKKIPDVYIGKYGKNPVIVATTSGSAKNRQGSIHAAIVATKILEKVKSIEYVIAVGVCFGIKEGKELGEIIISNMICDFTNKREGSDESETIQRGPHESVKTPILNIFDKNVLHRELPPGAKFDHGPVITTASLVSNAGVKEELKKFKPDALAGEMEGAGIMAAVEYATNTAYAIVVKGIADFGDDQKGLCKEWKSPAAQGAAYCVKVALSQKKF